MEFLASQKIWSGFKKSDFRLKSEKWHLWNGLSSNGWNHGCRDLWLRYNSCMELHWYIGLAYASLTTKIFKIKRKNKILLTFIASLECVESFLDQLVTNAWIFSTKFWCHFVHRFPKLAAQCKVNKASFSRKFTLNGKCRFQISNKSYQQISRNRMV